MGWPEAYSSARCVLVRSAAHTSDASAAPNRRPRNTVTEVRLGSFALSFSTQDATPAGLLPQAISLSARACVRSEARDATVDRRRRAARQISDSKRSAARCVREFVVERARTREFVRRMCCMDV